MYFLALFLYYFGVGSVGIDGGLPILYSRKRTGLETGDARTADEASALFI